MPKFLIEPHFRLQEWVAEEKGYFRAGRPRLRIPRADAGDRRQGPRQRRQGRRLPVVRGRPQASNVSCACHWTVNVAASNGHGQLFGRRLFGGAGRHFRAGGFTGEDAGRSCGRADLGRLSVRQPLRQRAGAGAIYLTPEQINLYFKTACCSSAWSSCSTASAPAAICSAGRLLRRATWLSQGHRHHLHDRAP